MDIFILYSLSKKGQTILLNYKITISYDGSRFMGSAIQPNYKTVQGTIENILKKLNITQKTIFSGRTDKDVHASSQVFSIKVPSFWDDTHKLKKTLQKMLPKEIQLKKIIKVPNDFHARFSAKKREYRYLISKKQLNSFNTNYLHYEAHINIETIKQASKIFLGCHDFKSFSKKGSDPSSTIRTIYKIDVYEYRDIVVIRFQANSYLRSQIRMMVDFLLKIGNKKLTQDDLIAQLHFHKTISKTLAPASGLYLSKVIY